MRDCQNLRGFARERGGRKCLGSTELFFVRAVAARALDALVIGEEKGVDKLSDEVFYGCFAKVRGG